MNWGAVSLEIGLLLLAFVVLAWDLAVGHRSAGARKGDYVIGGAGLLALLAWSFRLPVEVWDRDRPYPRLSFLPGVLKDKRFSETRRGWGYKKWEPFNEADF